MSTKTSRLVATLRESLYGSSFSAPAVIDDGHSWGLSSPFDVTGFAAASMGLACAEVAALEDHSNDGELVLSRELASRWFGFSVRPQGWELPPTWDAIAGVYRSSDRFIRLHTNAPHHREAALRVLGCANDRAHVEAAVSTWSAVELEQAIVEAGGCAAALYSREEWAAHPQGAAVSQEPLIHWQGHDGSTIPLRSDEQRPLRGLKILDCTRVLAGPVCTRLLAGYGAQVLRIDPPGWQEGAVEPEVNLGKRLATLDLKSGQGLQQFRDLLSQADVFVHGYRADALEALGLGVDQRRELNPDLIDVALCAYGWSGPWACRRGFDSLVQMSAGIAHEAMRLAGADEPIPLPVQALDQGTGYLMATAVLRALRARATSGKVLTARLSLARCAEFLAATSSASGQAPLPEENTDILSAETEHSSWGPVRRVAFPLLRGGIVPEWDIPARRLHSDPAIWT